jgi:competence protein ComEC
VLCDAGACGVPARVALTGVIDASPRPVAGGTRLRIAAEEIEWRGRRARVTGRVRIHVREETPEFRRGDRVRLRATLRPPRGYRNPGCADIPRILGREGIRRLGSVNASRDVALLDAAGRQAGLEVLRARLSAFLARTSPAEHGVLEALLLGEQGRIPAGVRDAYARAGVAHVLSVSGLHVALVALGTAGLAGALLRRAPRLAAGGHARHAALAAGMAAAWGYALLAGSQAPGLRSAAMAAALAAAAIARRRGDPRHALLLAAAWVALGDPARVFQIGTQLSFLSTAWLVLRWRDVAGPPAAHEEGPNLRARVRRAGRGLLRWARASVAISLGVTFVTLPIQGAAFGQVSLAAPIANLLVVPLEGSVAVSCLLLGAAALPAWEPLASALVHAAAAAVTLSTRFVLWLGPHPWAVLQTPVLSPPEGAAWMLLGFLLPLAPLVPRAAPGGRRRRRAAAACVLVLAAGFGLRLARPDAPPALRVTFLDVGQGDAALIETPEGSRILVDSGPAFHARGGVPLDAGASAVAPALRARGIRRIDVLAITHPDSDHAGGAVTLLERFRVGEVWHPAGAERASAMRAVTRAARARNVPVRALVRGAPTGLRGRTRVQVLGPSPAAVRAAVRDRRWNDASLVIRVAQPGLAVLLPGDVEAAGERALAGLGPAARADVLKVAHHGSATSSTPGFLAAVAPRMAVLSLGSWNRFGFPGAGVVERLEASGARVYRTDRDGAVSVTLARGRIEVRAAAAPRGQFAFNLWGVLDEKEDRESIRHPNVPGTHPVRSAPRRGSHRTGAEDYPP